MALHTPVPSETEPTSMVDLVNDCREVASVLGHSVLDLTQAVVRVPISRLPLDRLPLDRLPFSFGAMPAEITEDLLSTVSGLEDY
jgi:hypothetical protein